MERKSKKPYKAEDLVFASGAMQPSTVGQIYNCLYTVVVNRTISGLANYPTGVSVLMTINPSPAQLGGFPKIRVMPRWHPKLIDVRNVALTTAQANNNGGNVVVVS